MAGHEGEHVTHRTDSTAITGRAAVADALVQS